MHNQLGPHSPSIHILDDDSLLNVFYFCRPAPLYEDEVDYLRRGEWVRESWWYKFTHVCRRWRYLVHASASHLRLCLICTYGTPVAEMLAHSPPLPLIIDHVDKAREITAEDEEGIILALQHPDRVPRIRLLTPTPNLQKIILAMDDEFPMLEYLSIVPLAKHVICLKLPKTFQAPHLRHLILRNFAVPMRSALLTTAVGLVTLSLQWIHPSPYFRPNDMLQRLSLMPQLEILTIGFHLSDPNCELEVEMQLLDTPLETHVTLPNLRWFGFGGVSAFLEALLPQMTTPLLEKLEILFFNQLTFSIPHQLQFLRAGESLKFHNVVFRFSPRVLTMQVYPHRGAETCTLCMTVFRTHPGWLVTPAARIYDALRIAISAVEHITLRYGSGFIPLEDQQNAADRTEWREILRSFGDLKTLRVVDDGFVTQVSHSLRPGDEESPMELLPELKELEYFSSGDAGDVFTSFINSRKKAGHLVTLVRR